MDKSSPAVLGPVQSSVRPPASWLVRALVTLAKRELADANATCGDCWPAGQEWRDLGHTSQHAFMHRAREAAGIPHAEYRALIEAVMSTDEAEVLDALWTELERPNVEFSGVPAGHSSNHPAGGTSAATQG